MIHSAIRDPQSATPAFPQKGRRVDKPVGRCTQWLSRCRRYRVSRYREYRAQPIYYAEAADGRLWRILSRHRRRRTAEEACRRHARRRTPSRQGAKPPRAVTGSKLLPEVDCD